MSLAVIDGYQWGAERIGPLAGLRLKGKFWASPVIAGQRMIAFNYDGTGLIVDLSEKKGKIVDEIDMGENIQATPALNEDAMYVKGERHLWKIAGKE